MKAPRRSILKRLLAPLISAAGAQSFTNAFAEGKPDREVLNTEVPGMEMPRMDVPLYSGSARLGNMIFVSGAGAHFEGDIKAHTEHVLKEMEKELIKAGSSMDKVLKVNVLLHDLKDYKAMNEVYKGRFGNKPPVRTTVSTHAGVPGKSLVEIDCIAYV